MAYRCRYWTSAAITAATAKDYGGRAQAVGAELVFMMGVLEPTEWAVDKAKFPAGIKPTVDYFRSIGLQVRSTRNCNRNRNPATQPQPQPQP